MVSCYTSGWGHFPKTPFGRSTIRGSLLSEAFLNWEPFEDVKHNLSHTIHVICYAPGGNFKEK